MEGLVILTIRLQSWVLKAKQRRGQSSWLSTHCSILCFILRVTQSFLSGNSTILCMCVLGLGGNCGGKTSLYIAEAKVCYVERSTKVHSLSRIFAGPWIHFYKRSSSLVIYPWTIHIRTFFFPSPTNNPYLVIGSYFSWNRSVTFAF